MSKQKVNKRKEIDSLNFSNNNITFHSNGFSAILFSKGKRINKFFTEDSKLYITPREQQLEVKGVKINKEIHQWDSAVSRIIVDYQAQFGVDSFLWKQWEKRKLFLQENWRKQKENWRTYLTPPRFWDATIVGAILLGMFSMSLIYRYLGPSTSANNQILNTETINLSQRKEKRILNQKKKKEQTIDFQQQIQPKVLGVYSEEIDFSEKNKNLQSEEEFVTRVADYLQEKEKEKLEKKIKKMVKGYPIEEMLPYIMTKDRTTIAFLIGIAKKESNWGKRVPVLNGSDCYNYWGYRGKRRLMGSGGHTCFNSRKDAVDTVAKRIHYLVKNKKLNTPSKMVIWKCGNACHKHSRYSVNKWISDVGIYFNQLNHD